MNWKQRKVKLITQAEPGLSDEVLHRIIPLIGGEY
ncbi:transcription elongation factor GreAB, partial [Salmonella enterica]|nr:transcription elongation factor GreAB [Salmonella enterica]